MSTTIDATTPVAVAAALLTRERVGKICSRERKIVGPKEVKAVHDMRVESRRLREVLSLFEEWLDPTAYQELQQFGRGVTKALGRVRNADVALRFFRRLRKQLREEMERRVVKRIMERVSRARRKRRKVMMAAVKNLRLKRLRRDINAFLKVPKVDESNARPMLYELVQPVLHDRLECVFQYQSIVQNESKMEELHQMRIAFKKARYALEIFEPALGREYSKILNSLSGYQDLLGEIHDLDIFIEDLQRLSTRWRKKRKRPKLRAALDRVTERLIHQRHELFVQFSNYLNEHDSAAIMQACAASLEARRAPL